MSIDYKQDIEFKLQIVDYHFGICLNIIRSQEYDKRQAIALTAEFIAMMLAFQACLEYLAQFIKEKRGLPGKPSTFYFTTLHSNVDSYGEKTNDLKQDIKSLFKNSQYLRDFSNTVKHKNIIYPSNKELKINHSTNYNLIKIDSFQKGEVIHESVTIESFLHGFFKSLRQDIKSITEKV